MVLGYEPVDPIGFRFLDRSVFEIRLVAAEDIEEIASYRWVIELVDRVRIHEKFHGRSRALRGFTSCTVF